MSDRTRMVTSGAAFVVAAVFGVAAVVLFLNGERLLQLPLILIGASALYIGFRSGHSRPTSDKT